MDEADEMDEMDGGYQLTAEGFRRVMEDDLDDFDVEEVLFMRVCQSYEANELAPPVDEDLDCIWQWYDRVSMGQALLDMVLRGELYVHADHARGDAVFSITPRGRALCDEMESHETSN